MRSVTLLDALARIAYGRDYDGRYSSPPGDMSAEHNALQRRLRDLRWPTWSDLPDVTALLAGLAPVASDANQASLNEICEKVRVWRSQDVQAWEAAMAKIIQWLEDGALVTLDPDGKSVPQEYWHVDDLSGAMARRYRVSAAGLFRLIEGLPLVSGGAPAEKPDHADLAAWYVPYAEAHPRATDREVKDAANKHFGQLCQSVTDAMVTTVRRGPDGRKRRVGRKPGKKITPS